MRYKGKITAGTLGLLLGGPIGLFLGILIGHLYDNGYLRAIISATQTGVHTHAQKVFFENTFKIMGYVAKSDGRVSQNEIDTARTIMAKMGLNELLKQRAMTLFSIGKQKDFNIEHALIELRQVCRMQPALLQLFLDIQLQIASADGGLTPTKRDTLQHICNQLGIVGYHFHQQDQKQWQHQYQYRQQQRPQSSSDHLSLDEAYNLLDISSNATADEIKKAYRRAMSQNHPDKLIAKGLPPEMIKVATQKTQRIKKAFDQIKKARGL